jgi:HD-like signal output (HDOD) protein
MNSDLNLKIEAYIKDMPSLPTSVGKILELCNNPQTKASDLNYVISLDPVLVGRVLKLINSAYYGMCDNVTNMVRAIIMLGINTVKNLALSAAVIGAISANEKKSGLDMAGFWRHSLCVGVASKLLARQRGIDPGLLEEYFTAGLLHDLGKIPLNAVVGKDYVLVLSAADRKRIALYRGEEKLLNMSHCDSGAAIVKAWQLEGPVGDGIVYHHFPAFYTGIHTDILYNVIAANYFACSGDIGFSGDKHPDILERHIWEALGVTRKAFDSMEPVVNGEISKAEVFLKL